MNKCDLKIVSYNVRGLNNYRKRTAIFKHLKGGQCDIVFLQETYSSEEVTNKWLQECEGKGLFMHGSKHSRGVAILFRKQLDFEIEEKYLDFKGRFIIVKIKINELKINLVNIYAPNKENDQIVFMTELIRIIGLNNVSKSDNNILAGDWNVALDYNVDKMGGRDKDDKKIYKEKIQELTAHLELVDIWRLKHSLKKQYTWRQKVPRIHCRLDYFFISQHVMDLVIDTKILPSILSDHSPVSLDLNFLNEPKLGQGHWKLNVSLLSDDIYKTKLKENLNVWKEQYKDFQNLNLKWEIIKFEIRRFSISYSKSRMRKKRDRKVMLGQKLTYLEQKEYKKDEIIFREIDLIKDELNNILLEEAQGSIIRSRAQWAEQGEKSTSYFFNLEKHNNLK